MRVLLWLGLGLLSGCTSLGSPVTSRFDIRITGDTPFDGKYVLYRGQQVESYEFQSELPPLTLRREATRVVVEIRKQRGPGLLAVEIFKDGKRVLQQSTTRDFGPVELDSR
jgi:hypothetical protein